MPFLHEALGAYKVHKIVSLVRILSSDNFLSQEIQHNKFQFNHVYVSNYL